MRGHHEPCGFFCAELDLLLLHHVDDGRMTGPHEAMSKMIQHLAFFLLLKVSRPIVEGIAYKYLGRTKLRLRNGWLNIPDHGIALKVLERLGYVESRPTVADTPGVKRASDDLDR